MKEVLIALVLFVATTSSYGADYDCGDKTPGARIDCVEKLAERADAELKRVFGKAIAYINSKDNAHLSKEDRESWRAAALNSQRSWEAYRQTECNTVTPYLWGTGSGVTAAISECELERTRDRIRELKQTYSITK